METFRLVKRAKQGDKEALLQLMLAAKDEYYRLALVYMGNEHDAMDALEDMIVIVYENIGTLRKWQSFYSWSKTILVNCCKQMLRKQNKTVLFEDWHTVSGHESMTHNPFDRLDHKLVISPLFMQLNEHQREAIQLKYVHDLDYRTIAQMTNVSIGTVKSRVFHGLQRLKQLLGGNANGELGEMAGRGEEKHESHPGS